jgi:phosphoribosyl-ATP pyrophosphohydrolase
VIIPSIDLMNGRAVVLREGDRKHLQKDLGDPRPLLGRFGRVGEVALVDLDAAMNQGDNAALITELLPLARCRVGGGIRDRATAERWLNAGAAKVIIGTKATPELLRDLPKERVITALDARDNDVVVDGWQTRTGKSIEIRLQELGEVCREFLVTFVEREGHLRGTDVARAQALCALVPEARFTFAGGITTAAEVAELDRHGADAQVGLALHTGDLPLAAGFAAPLVSDRADGLWPTLVVDELCVAVGLVWSNLQSLTVALEEGRGVYWSRRRGLWRKGERSGAAQELLRVDMDCDRDALRFTVRQSGAGFCHRQTHGCFGAEQGLAALWRTLCERRDQGLASSYTRRLLEQPELLADKLVEEAHELASAAGRAEVIWEAADLMYFTLVAMVRSGVSLPEVAAELDRRRQRLDHRGTTGEKIRGQAE